jgi:hypothetical protein
MSNRIITPKEMQEAIKKAVLEASKKYKLTKEKEKILLRITRGWLGV